jgi:hypothetical protein
LENSIGTQHWKTVLITVLKIAFENGVGNNFRKRHWKTMLKKGIEKRHQKTALENDVGKRHWKMTFENEVKSDIGNDVGKQL